MLELERTAVADEGVGVLRPTDALSRRPGAGLGSRTRLRARSRTFVQPMGASVGRSSARRA